MKQLLIIDNLTVHIQSVPVILSASLTVHAGDCIGIIGANGSGKSTLAHTIAGHYPIVSGQIHYQGYDIGLQKPDMRARAGIFMSFQQPPDIPGVSVFSFLKEAYGCLVHEIASDVFYTLVTPIFDRVGLPVHYLDRTMSGFSGGEKKRLELVQLLLYKPRLALLDEIDTGLDPEALVLLTKEIAQLRQECPEMALIFISHNMDILRTFQVHRVYRMEQGRVCAV